MRCKCGSARFMAHQISRHDVIVDEHGDWLEDRGIYDSERPYGPFTCMACGQEYDELPQIQNNEIAAIMLKDFFKRTKENL